MHIYISHRVLLLMVRHVYTPCRDARGSIPRQQRRTPAFPRSIISFRRVCVCVCVCLCVCVDVCVCVCVCVWLARVFMFSARV